MDESQKVSLQAEFRIMDYTNTKPNYAELARKYNKDYRTIKKYHEGYEGKPRTRSKPSRLDIYREVIEEKLSIPRTTRKGVYEFLVDRYGIEKVGSYSNFKAYCKKNSLSPAKSNTPGGGSTRYETEPADMAQCDWLCKDSHNQSHCAMSAGSVSYRVDPPPGVFDFAGERLFFLQ